MVPDALQAVSAYVIPPLLGFIVLLGLALVSLLRGGRKRTNILFSGICLLGALLNADVALVSIVSDSSSSSAFLSISVLYMYFWVSADDGGWRLRRCCSASLS
jgi:hypothetical protein